MDIERLKQRLNGVTSKNNVNDDTYLKISLDGSQRLLPPDEINKTVNEADRFNTERNRSPFYRIIGTINPVMSNPLFNLNDNVKNDAFTWATFNNLLFLDTSYPKDGDVADKTDYTYPESIKNSLVEHDGWFGHFDPDITKSGLCNFFDMEPKRERLSFIPDSSPYHPSIQQSTDNTTQIKNWELTITYPASADTTHYMVAGGLLIIEAITVSVSTRLMTAFGVACKHNLNIGDVVRISGTSGFDGEFVVVRTCLDNGDSKENYFVLDIQNTGIISPNSRFKKVVNGFESTYYFRKFKKIKTRHAPVIETDDYETYKLAFSENAYYDSITQFVFNEDIDVSDLTDNLGRPLSELYLSIIKKDSNGLFSSISSGIETPFIEKFNTGDFNTYLRALPVINKIHNGGSLPFNSYTPLEQNIDISNQLFYGDLVEFNNNTLTEVVLADVHHRFNTINRETPAIINAVDILQASAATLITDSLLMGPRQEGYHYKAHHLMQIRDFSNYVETGDVNTSGMPSYTIDLGDGRFIWRDLLDIGFSDISQKPINHPFLNGCHYLYQNLCFYLKRQDPFNQWDLFYGHFPADPIGERITDKFKTNSEQDVC